MKLLACFTCNDVFNLTYHKKECKCTLVGGAYSSDGVTAHVHMPDRLSGAVLGFANSTIGAAIKEQQLEGDLPKTMRYAGEMVSPGRTFDAFVIPESAPSVVITYTDEHIYPE